MSRRFLCLLAAVALAAMFPNSAPAPLVYIPGEGMHYEPFGSTGNWRQQRAEDQLQVSQTAFDEQDYSLALRSCKYLLKTWPLSDYAPAAQFLLARSYELKGSDERAFDAYQVIFEKYPKSEHINEALHHQYDIATRFLNGKRFRLWKVIPFFPDMSRTAKLYAQIVKSAPFSDVAPHAQLRIGAAMEKAKDYPAAAAAYEHAADKYHDQPVIAADALYRAGIVYAKQAATAEYDQGTAGQAIDTFTDFITLYPSDQRISEAQDIILRLRNEQARGNFEIAKFYARRGKWAGARVYYNEVILKGPESPLVPEARRQIDEINKRMPATSP